MDSFASIDGLQVRWDHVQASDPIVDTHSALSVLQAADPWILTSLVNINARRARIRQKGRDENRAL